MTTAIHPVPTVRLRWEVDPETGCWEWTGPREGRRYAQDWTKAHYGELVHRVHYEAVHGAIPSDCEVDHLCGNTFCVNPWHLEAVSHAENMHRGRCTTLSTEATAAIRASTEVSAVVAAEYGVSPGYVRRLRGPLRDKGVMRKGVR